MRRLSGLPGRGRGIGAQTRVGRDHHDGIGTGESASKGGFMAPRPEGFKRSAIGWLIGGDRRGGARCGPWQSRQARVARPTSVVPQQDPERDGHIGNDGPDRLCGPGRLLRPAVVGRHLQRLPDAGQVRALHRRRSSPTPRHARGTARRHTSVSSSPSSTSRTAIPCPARRRGYSFNRVLKINSPQDPGALITAMKSVTGVRNTVTFKLKAPTRCGGRVDDRRGSDRRPEGVSVRQAPASTRRSSGPGPYELKTYTPKQLAVFVPNPHYGGQRRPAQQ